MSNRKQQTFLRMNLFSAGLLATLFALGLPLTPALFAQEDGATEESMTADEMQLVRDAEAQRIKVIQKVVGSVVAVYGPSRQGGGSGVIIDPSGIALTNHHVVASAGLKGFGGLDDGKLYEWDLIGTDPGGDVAIIKLKGKDEFPWSPLGDSDKVKVGDWSLAMGNPFLLAHDQVPTVTLGVVSGVERFQEGAGSNQLVYGNCIQIDSSINPGNSGGPLFNMQGEVIGINGRGSFRDRGRVNVGLGYAISSNQIRNFIPDLMASKIVEHGTLDAAFSNRDGKVICSTIDLDSKAAEAGLELGDELLEFEGRKISHANQFKNLICTLPEDWPAHLKVRKEDGSELTINVRMFGLPYNFQPDEEPPTPEPDDEGKKKKGGKDGGDKESKDEKDSDEEKEPEDAKKKGDAKKGDGKRRNRRTPRRPQRPDNADLKKFMLNEPGVVIDKKVNQASVDLLMQHWRRFAFTDPDLQKNDVARFIRIEDELVRDGKAIGQQTIYASKKGEFRIEHRVDDQAPQTYIFDGNKFWSVEDGKAVEFDLVESKTNPVLTQGLAVTAAFHEKPFHQFGKAILDGGDKAQEIVSSRLMMLDDNDDWFYCWFSLYDEDGYPQVRLLKMSSHKDTKEGISLGDYREYSGIQIPYQKHFVTGLTERVKWTAATKSVEAMATLDEQLFSASKGASE